MSKAEKARVAEIADGLGRWVEGAPPALQTWLSAIADLIEADQPLAYGLQISGEGYRVEFLEGPRATPARRRAARGWLAGQRRPFGAYDPSRPEPDQRNRAVSLRDVRSDLEQVNRSLLPGLSLFGVADHDQLRALICDGPSLLAWVGGFRRGTFGAREKLRLAGLVPALHRRLRLERLIDRSPLDVALLSVLLARIATPAWVVREKDLAIVHCNEAGQEVYADREARSGIGDAIRNRDQRYDITPLIANGLPAHLLVVERRPPNSPDARLAEARRCWGLTDRQAAVLALIVEGHANKTIAAELSCSNRTVEVHVTALLDKAGCDGRAALVAAFWRARSPEDYGVWSGRASRR